MESGDNYDRETLSRSDSNSAPILEKRILTSREQIDEINKNYLPNLSEYQQILYKIKNDKEEDEPLYPNINYQDESKKGFYIFYNNNLAGLKDLYTKELSQLKENHPVVLYHIKEFLEKLEDKYDEDTYYAPFRLISKVISYKYEDIVKKARAIAHNLIKINKIEKKYGIDILKRAAEIKICDKKIFDEISDDDEQEQCDYPAIERNFSDLANKYKDSLSYITQLNLLLKKYLKKFGENIVDLNQKKKICFILNRASFYLSNKEKLKEQYELNILIKMDRLRRKIDYLLLQNRFKFEQNKRPFLHINIERCIILINSLETTSIYIEKIELQKFIEELEKALQRKANNLKERKNFDVLSLDEIREIVQVRDINISSYENIREAIQNKIEELEEEKERNEAEIQSIAANLGIQFVGDSVKTIVGAPPLNQLLKEEKKGNTEGEPKKEGMDRINELRKENKKIERKIRNFKNKLKRIKVNQNYDIQFINIMKLYQQLIRRNYHIRKDFSGIILSEKRKMASIHLKNSMKFEEQANYREYETNEISKEIEEVIDTEKAEETKPEYIENEEN